MNYWYYWLVFGWYYWYYWIAQEKNNVRLRKSNKVIDLLERHYKIIFVLQFKTNRTDLGFLFLKKHNPGFDFLN